MKNMHATHIILALSRRLWFPKHQIKKFSSFLNILQDSSSSRHHSIVSSEPVFQSTHSVNNEPLNRAESLGLLSSVRAVLVCGKTTHYFLARTRTKHRLHRSTTQTRGMGHNRCHCEAFQAVERPGRKQQTPNSSHQTLSEDTEQEQGTLPGIQQVSRKCATI